MGVKERRERERESLRTEILDAAREMFAREGYQNVSMRKIADEIEYSPTTIYLYFKDKTDLLNQLCEETFGQLGRHIGEITEAEKDPLEGLRKGMRAYIEFGLEHPNHYEIAFITPLMHTLEGNEYPFEGSMGQRTFNHLQTSVAACMEAGVIGENDVALISQTLWAGMHGITSLLIGHPGFPFVERDKLIGNVVETLVNGVSK